MLLIHTTDRPLQDAARVPPEQLRSITVADFLRQARAAGYAVVQHRAAFYRVRLH